MQRAWFFRGLATVCGLAMAMTLAPPAAAQSCGGSGFHGVYRTYPNHRLSRHRSGYLYRPMRYQRYRSPVRIYDGYYGGSGGSGCTDAIPDDRADFDFRRDRLLDRATQIDVSYVDSATTYDWHNNVRPRPKPSKGNGWALLREGQGVRALGRFTARLMSAPTDAEALAGYALAATILGDDEAARRSMRKALEIDAAAVAALRQDERLSPELQASVQRHEALVRGADAAADPVAAADTNADTEADADTDTVALAGAVVFAVRSTAVAPPQP
ncbi:MAG: tetratricopeptide repeat protein [Planctomycetota bacterium]|jgi:hypothetical protein